MTSTVTSARFAVALALHGVFGRGQRVPDTWDEGLSGEEARFAQALLGHCLRAWGRLQAYAKPQFRQLDRGVPLGTQIALALGFAQLAWMGGVEAFAAVDQAVELVADAELGFRPHRGLVNALLRRAAEDRDALASKLADLPAALDRTWFTERLLEEALAPHGATDCKELLWSRLLEPHEAAYRAVVPGSEPEDLGPDPDVPGCLRLREGGVFPRGWLVSGRGMVQDRSSQALLNFQWDRPVKQILDACAAPGGKTTNLVLRFPSAQLFAVEFNRRRARRLQETLSLRGLADRVAEVVVQDASAWLRQSSHLFDLILVDAPCSGTGTYRKHPELGWIGPKIDLTALVAQQRELLEAALFRLAPGGLLIYAVCSWLPEECAEHREWALRSFPEVVPVEVWPTGMGVEPGATSFFRPNPILWDGEGFQGFALCRGDRLSESAVRPNP
jgi:16S rRNA (cytosine967-C5)-methyltransferase